MNESFISKVVAFITGKRYEMESTFQKQRLDDVVHAINDYKATKSLVDERSLMLGVLYGRRLYFD